MKTALKYYWPAILWALFVFILCSIKLGKVSESPTFFPGFDKLVHCGFFFLVIVFTVTGYIRQQDRHGLSYKALLLFVLAAIAYGGLIELLQEYVFTWRDGGWDDLFADCVGTGMGAFAIMITVKAMRYEKN